MNSPIIQNRYEFKYYLACTNANPNGDPDMGNMPRTDPDTMNGIITDGATKRRIRDYIQMVFRARPGMGIFVQRGVNLNRLTAETKEAAGVNTADVTKRAIEASRAKACELYWDVRTFGAVMSPGPNGGQVRGPVQIAFGESIDPVRPTDIGITRVCCADNLNRDSTAADYKAAEDATPENELRTMGRKQFIPFGLYEIHGSVSANLAEQTGFTEADLLCLFEAMANMYDATRSASKGMMSVVSPVIIFKHVGEPGVPADQAAQSAKLGRAPAHKLLELVDCHKKSGIETPSSYHDYECCVNISGLPRGVEIGFLPSYSQTGITWGKLPDGETWMTSK